MRAAFAHRLLIVVAALAVAAALSPLARAAPVHTAAANGDIPLMRSLLASGADVNSTDAWQGVTPLHYAAEHDRLAAVRFLLSKGARLDAGNSLGETPLCYYLAYHDCDSPLPRIPSYLVSAGAGVNVRSKYGYTPLYWSVRRGCATLTRLMLAKRGRVDVFVAAGLGDTGQLGRLLARGVSASSIDGQGYSPLHWAAEGGHPAAVALLIKHGADVNVANRRGFTPLHFACGGSTARSELPSDRAKVVAVVGQLLSHGVDVNAPVRHGRTALDLAESRGLTAVADLLRRAGAKRGTAAPPR